jgi:hypothetical protein
VATYILRNAEQLNKDFYVRLDENFIYSKAMTLSVILENHEKFLAENQASFSDISEKKYKETLAAEIHFSELLQFEAFFALLLAPYQQLPHWLYLTAYKTNELKDAMIDFRDGNFSKITSGVADTAEDFFNISIYSGFVKSTDEKPWSKNIENIHDVVHRMADKYIDAKEFNAYKHGLRVYTGETALKIVDNNKPNDPGVSWRSRDSLVFLETERREDGDMQVYRAIKHFNPDESINHLYIMKLMISCVKNTRTARLEKRDETQIEVFQDINMEELRKLRVITKFRFNF